MKYSKSAIGLLTAQYRSVLKKCWMINVGLFALGGALLTATPAEAEVPLAVSSTVPLADGAGGTYTVNSNIGTVALTAEAIKNALGTEAVANAGHATSANTATSATTAIDATYASALKVEGTVYSLNYFAKATDYSALVAGTTPFTKLNVGSVQATGGSGTLTVDGNLALTSGKSFSVDGSSLSAGTLDLGTASLTSDASGAISTSHLKATTDLKIGTSDAMTGVDNAVTSGNNTKLITSGAVYSAINAAKADAAVYTPTGAGATAYYDSIATTSAALDKVGTDMGLLKGTDSQSGSVKNSIKTLASDATYKTDSAAGSIGAAIKANADDLNVLKTGSATTAGSLSYRIDQEAEDAHFTKTATAVSGEDSLGESSTITTAVNSVASATNTNSAKLKGLSEATVQGAIDAAMGNASTFTTTSELDTTGRIYNGIADSSNKVNVGDALNRAGTWIENNKADITTLNGDDTVTDSVKYSIKTLADAAEHTKTNASKTTIGAAINANEQAIADLNAADTNDKSVAYKIKNNAAKAAYSASATDYTAGTIGKAIQDNAAAITANNTKLADLKKSDGTAATTVQAAIDSARKGIASKTLNIGEDAGDIRLGKANGDQFTGLSVDNANKAISLLAHGTTPSGLKIDSTGAISLGTTGVVTDFYGIELSNAGRTVTVKGATKNITMIDGAITADSATLNGLTLNGSSTVKVDKISSAAAITGTPDNDTLATTAAVKATVDTVSSALNDYATKAEVHGSGDVATVNLGEAAKTINVGTADAGVVVSNEAKSAEIKAKATAGNNTINVDASGIKLGNQDGSTFDGLSYTKANGVVIGSGDNTVTAKAGALTATGNITSNATVKGATLEATTGLKIGSAEATSIDNAGTGASGTTAPTDGKALASTLTVWNAAEAAKTAATAYDPSASILTKTTVQEAIDEAAGLIDTNKTKSEANETKLAGLKMYDGTTEAATVQAALTDFHDKSQAYTLDNIKTGAQNANYDAGTYADGTIGAAIKANADKIATLNGTGDGSVDKKITDQAENATFTDSATAHTSVGGATTIGGAIQNIAGAVDANTAKFAGLSKSTVQASIDDAITTAGTTADGKYVAKTYLDNTVSGLTVDATAGSEKVTAYAKNGEYKTSAIEVAGTTIKLGTTVKHGAEPDTYAGLTLSNDGKTATFVDGDNSVAIASGAVTATGAVKAASFQLGDKEVTSIDSGAALSYAADATDADKKVMATDAAVKATVKALAEGAVKNNTDAIALLNDADTKAGSVKNSIKTLASDATYKADSAEGSIGAAITANTTKLAGLKKADQTDAATVQEAIVSYSDAGKTDLANVLNGTTPFTKVNVGDAWSLVKNSGNNLSIRSSNGENSAIFANNSMTLLDSSEGAGKEYFSVSNNGGLNLKKGGETDPYFNVQTNGNIESKGTLTLKDASDQAAQTLNAAKIKQITTNQTNIGNMSQLHGSDNAMVNRGAGDVAGDPAANIVEALNNISASVGNVHGLAKAAANGSLDTKYASQQKPADWYKNGAGNLFPGSATDDHLAELAASIGNRAPLLNGNYTKDAAATTAPTELSIAEAIKNMDTNIYNKISGIENDYVTKAYFNGGDTNNAISMGSGAKDIVIGHTSTDDTLDNGTTLTVDNETGKITAKVFTGTDGTNPKETATLEMSKDGAKVTSGDKNVVIDEGNVIADAKVSAKNLAATDDVVVGTDGTAPYSKIEKGAATFAGTNKTVSIADGAITAGGDVTGANFVTAGDVTADGTAWAKTSLKLGAAGSEATAIDNAGTVMTAAPTDDGKTLASTLTVYNNIQDATTVAAATNGNYAAGSVKDAVASIDKNMGNLSWYNGTHYANTGSTKTSLAAAIKNMDTAIYGKLGDMNLTTATNYANTAAATDLTVTDAIKNIDTNVKAAIDGLDDTYVTQDYFNGEDGAAGSAVIMGRSSNDIEIGKQEFDTSGPVKLKSGIKITNGTSNTIEIGNYTDDDFYGIQVSNGGKSVTVAGLNKDVTIVDGDITTAGKVQATKLELSDGASTPTITEATAIDNAGTVMTAAPADGKTLASTLTVYNNVQDATVFKAAEVTANTHNYAAGDTVKQAIANLDNVAGDRQVYRSSHYANPDSTDISLADAVKNLDTEVYTIANDYVKISYFNNGEPATLPDSSANPNAGLISMGSGATTIQIGKVDATSGLNGIIINNTADDKTIKIGNNTQNVTVDGGDLTATGKVIANAVEAATSMKIGTSEATLFDNATAAITASVAGADGAEKKMANVAEVYNTVKTNAEEADYTKGGTTTTIGAAIKANTDEIAKRDVSISTAKIGNVEGVELVTVTDGTDTATTLTSTGLATFFNKKQIWLDKELGIDSGDLTGNPYHTAFSGAFNLTNDADTTMTGAIMELDGAIADRKLYNGTHYANPNSAADADPISLSQAIKNIDDNVFAKVGTVDLSTAINYANTTATQADNLTEAVVNIDKNVKQAIDDLDGKFVTKAYFNGVDEDGVTPIDISMGSKANTITIGKTSTTTVGSDTVTTLTNGVAIDNTNNSVVVGRQTVDSEGVAKLQTGMNVNGKNGTIDIVSVNSTDNSSNGISMDKDIVKIGTISNGKFEGISIQDGVMTNADPEDANSKSTLSSAELNITKTTTGDNAKTYTASVKADEVSVTDGTTTASVKADEVKVAASDTKYTSTTVDGMTVKNGDNTSTVTATEMKVAASDTKYTSTTAAGVSVKDGDNTADLTAASLIMDDTDNKTTVKATGVTVENADAGTKTTVASGSIEVKDTDGTTKITGAGVETGSLKLGTSTQVATAISDGSAVADYEPGTEAEATAKATLATNATVKATVDGVVADIEKQIHGDPNDPTVDVTIGEYADNTIIGKVSTDTTKPLNTNINVDTANNKITLETADISNDKQTSTGIELDNAKQTIDITSANGKLGTETGLKITNEGADDQHLIELTYTHKGQDDKVDTERGLIMDADEQAYSLGSTDVKNGKFSGLDIDAAENTYALGKGTIDDQGELTLDYGMTMDAENGVTTFADKDGNGVTMNKGDMTVTDSATVGSVDETTGELSGVKLDKAGNAQASNSATVGQVDDQGALDGNGVQMKNDGSAKFSATEGAVTVEKGGVIADNNVTVGDNTADDYIDLAKQDDGSYKATFASADGNVEIAGGSITADNKVTADEIEAKNSIYVGDPAGEIAALYKTGLVAVKDADNQATYGSGGMWAKKKTDDGKTYAADFGGTGLSVSQLDPSDPTSVIASAGVSETGLWTQSDSKKSSYGNDGLWIGNKAETAFASLNERALFITDGTDTSNIGLDGIYTSQNISAAGNSYVGGNSQVDGVATFGKDAGKQVVIDSGDVTADGKVKGKDLEATNSFTLAGTTVHAIDDSDAKINDFSGAGHDVDTLATTSSIYYNAEDSLYTPQQGTYTTVDATTINEALTAVDNIIGNFPDGLHYDNHNLDNGGQAKPENIVDAFNNIDATLGQIHGLAAKLESEGTYMGNLAEGTTVENHLTALDASIGDRRAYTQQNVIKNNESTAKSLDALDMAVGDISKLQGTTYASADNLSDAVVQIDDKLQNLDGRMERAEKDLKDVHHELRRGMASMAAMSALVPNSRSTGKTSLSLGTGAYSGHNAVAVGGFHYLTDNLMLNAGAAWSNSRDAVYRVGVTYSF